MTRNLPPTESRFHINWDFKSISVDESVRKPTETFDLVVLFVWLKQMWWDTKKICTLVKEYRDMKRKRPTLSHSYTYDRRLVQARRGAIGDQQVLPGLPTNRPQCKPFYLNKFLSGVFVQFSQPFCVWDSWRKWKEWLRFSMAKLYLRTHGIWCKLVGSPKFRFFGHLSGKLVFNSV